MSLGNSGSSLGIKSLSDMIVFKVSALYKATTLCTPVKETL